MLDKEIFNIVWMTLECIMEFMSIYFSVFVKSDLVCKSNSDSI